MSDIINTSKTQSVEIDAQIYRINGEDIGTGILPKLVHRVKLHPTYDDKTGGVAQNQYFTLHNDAGRLLYTSKFVQDPQQFIVEEDDPPPPIPPIPPIPPVPPIPPPDGIPVPDDEEKDEEWHVFPIVIPSGPWGPRRPRRRVSSKPRTTVVRPKPKPEKEEEEDPEIRYIDGMYTNRAITKIPSSDQREWENMKVYSAALTFSGTAITSINLPWTRLTNGEGMFSKCSKLRAIHTRTRFPSLINGNQLFDSCGDLRGFFMDEGFSQFGNHFDFRNLKTAIRMFADCPNIPHVYLYLPKVTNTSSMFINDTSLTVVDIDYAGNAPANKKAVSMYEGCKNLMQLSPKAVFQNSLEDASYMFWNCTSLRQFPVSSMGMLKNGSGMFYNCTSLNSMNCSFPSLENASSMYQNSGVTSFNSNGYGKVTNGKQMFANCSLNNVDINFPALTNGQNMFRNCGITHINSINLPSLVNGAGLFGGCSLDKESALKVLGIASSVESITSYITMGVSSSLMEDAEFRAACHLPEEVPDTAATDGELGFLNEEHTKAIGIFWN